VDRLDWIALLLATGIVSFLLFIPPAVGLADNGDFAKIIGRFDLYQPNQANGFADTTYRIDPLHHWTGDVISSEILPAAVAVGLNRIFSSSTFDMRWIGAVHAALYLLAFYLALPLMRGLPLLGRLILLAAIVAILGDVMYVSALNSFYMDTAAWIFLCLCVVLYLRALRRCSRADRIGLLICLALLIASKTQHIVAGCVIFALMLLTRRQLGLTRAWLGSAALTTAASMAIAFIGTPPGYATIQSFNIIFYELLPHSDNVHRDLAQLGLDDSYARWSGMHTYSEGSPMTADPQFSRVFGGRTGQGHIAAFYARHPGEAWRLLIAAMAEAGRQRPYLGNYDRRSAREFTESNSFAVWSSLKRALFWHNGRLYLAYVLGLLGLLCFLGWRRRIFAGVVAFSVLTIIEMSICSLGDVLDTLRHEWVFNGLTDLAVVFVVALAVGKRTGLETCSTGSTVES
jgi:hypothetical protein